MGGIFSRIWLLPRRKKSSKETLEALESELRLLTKTREGSQKYERSVISTLLVILLLIYPVILIIGVIFWIWFTAMLSNGYIFVYFLLVITFPILLYGAKRVTNTWFAHRKTQYNSAIQSVHEEKKKVLDDVMETEPYKVARELLEKYDPKNPQLLPREVPISETQQTVRQRRPNVPQSPHPALHHQTPVRTQRVTLNTPHQPQPLFVQQTPLATPRNNNGNGREPISVATPLVTARSQYPNPALPLETSQQFIPPGHCLGVAPGPPNPVPILPRDRTGFDKVMDFVLGDGPNNRYALVCSECHSHNGMALKDEFEYLSFRCAYCYFMNQAKKSRPTIKRPSVSSQLPDDSKKDDSTTTGVPVEENSNIVSTKQDSEQDSEDNTNN